MDISESFACDSLEPTVRQALVSFSLVNDSHLPVLPTSRALRHLFQSNKQALLAVLVLVVARYQEGYMDMAVIRSTELSSPYTLNPDR